MSSLLADWPGWRYILVWSVWRNSVGNARRVPFLGMDMPDQKDMVVYIPLGSLTWQRPQPWEEYRKLGPYLARYGYRWELRFPWNATRFFWIGWRIAQQDAPNTNIGFAFQPWAKL